MKQKRRKRKPKHILIQKIRNYNFLKDNIYWLVLSLMLLCASLITKHKDGSFALQKKIEVKLQSQITQAELAFDNWQNKLTDANFITTALALHTTQQIAENTTQLIFLYDSTIVFNELLYWNNQIVIPDRAIINNAKNKGLAKLVNGCYFYQKKQIANRWFIALLPIKWNYIITNQYLKNEFIEAPSIGDNFTINSKKTATNIFLKNGEFLYGIQPKAIINPVDENVITIVLRVASLICFLLFIHFIAVYINTNRGITIAGTYLLLVLLGIRLITYLFYSTIQLRQFNLFDPSIYGANFISKSLGDVLINVLLCLWIILFIKSKVGDSFDKLQPSSPWASRICTIAIASTLLLATYIAQGLLRSLVADSQISYDVNNFFSLDIYSVIGFFICCAITIAYYHFCYMALLIVKKICNNNLLNLFLAVAIIGLIVLTSRVGVQGFFIEFISLFWLLLFLFIVYKQLAIGNVNKAILSKTVFWLLFFSTTLTSIIFYENGNKDLANRKYFAEVISAKTNGINGAVLHTILTEMRPSVLAEKFYLFKQKQTGVILKDSLLNNNFSSYRNNYDTKMLVYDSSENLLFGDNGISYSAISSILNTQAIPTDIDQLYYVQNGFQKYSYLAKRIIIGSNNSVLGYIFLIITPKMLEQDELSPTLFSRVNMQNRLGTLYDYASYKSGKLIYSQNDYPFVSAIGEMKFYGNQFIQLKKGKYIELWYNAGGDRYTVVVKKNNTGYELISLLSFLFCSYMLFYGGIKFFTLLFQSKFKWRILKVRLRFNIKQQIQNTIVAFSVFSFLIIGILTILFFINRHEANSKLMLNSMSKIISNDLSTLVTKAEIDNSSFMPSQYDTATLVKAIHTFAKIHKQEVNLYNVDGNLKASSLPMPYLKGIISTKMNAQAYHHLHNLRQIQYFQNEQIGKLAYVSNYLAVLDGKGNPIAYVNMPYFTSQTRLKEEISSFLVTIIILNAFILLVAGIVALLITNRITSTFSIISNKMKQINLTKSNEIIQWHSNDEIGALVKEYNKMVTKLDASVATLAKKEREYAWQEMAKQIAHEIKNPLTPMKLSMQFLQKAIADDKPNIKALSTSVAATLVEQIDHLSTIAAGFSQFADIEKVNETQFDINEIFTSLKALYHNTENLSITWIYDDTAAYIFADKTHINRIFTNLILNGIQAVASHNMPTLIIKRIVQDDIVQIQITDNGVGVADHVKPNMFMPNFTTKSSGTGLGLSMCMRMVEQARGTIHYQTNSKGTTFIVRLPIVNSNS